MTPHFPIWSFGPKIESVDGICQQTDSRNRFYLDVKTGPNTAVDRREIFFGVGLLQVRTTTSDHSVFLLSFVLEQEQGPKNNYCRSLWLLCRQVVVVVVVVVSHIQRIGCQPEKTTLHGGQSRSWSAEQGKENKRKSLAAYPPPPTPHTARSEKINKITRRIYRRYAGGRSRVRTRIPSARRLGLWVRLRKILHSRLR